MMKVPWNCTLLLEENKATAARKIQLSQPPQHDFHVKHFQAFEQFDCYWGCYNGPAAPMPGMIAAIMDMQGEGTLLEVVREDG